MPKKERVHVYSTTDQDVLKQWDAFIARRSFYADQVAELKGRYPGYDVMVFTTNDGEQWVDALRGSACPGNLVSWWKPSARQWRPRKTDKELWKWWASIRMPSLHLNGTPLTVSRYTGQVGRFKLIGPEIELIDGTMWAIWDVDPNKTDGYLVADKHTPLDTSIWHERKPSEYWTIKEALDA